MTSIKFPQETMLFRPILPINIINQTALEVNTQVMTLGTEGKEKIPKEIYYLLNSNQTFLSVTVYAKAFLSLFSFSIGSILFL